MRLVDDIAERMRDKTSEELVSIYTKNDRVEWSDFAFEAIRRVLTERGIPVPQQIGSTAVEDALKILPAIPYKKALALDSNFRSWTILLGVWVILGFFASCAAWVACGNYSKGVAIIRAAASPSPSFSIRPDVPEETVRRLSKHMDKLESLEPFFRFSVGEAVIAWICPIFILRQFNRRTYLGPKMLLGLFCCLFAFDTVFALSTIGIPRSEVQELLDVDTLRIMPFVRLVFLISVLPLFSRITPLYCQYVRIDEEAFSRPGAVWRFLAPHEIPARIKKLTSRRKRSAYGALAFATLACFVVLTFITAIRNTPSGGVLFVISYVLFSVVAIWTAIESSLLASVLFSSHVLVLLAGLSTCGVFSFLAILFLRRKARKELALAPHQS
jgi:hypothetical protein